MRTGDSPSPSAAPRSPWGGIPEAQRGYSPSDPAEVAPSSRSLSPGFPRCPLSSGGGHVPERPGSVGRAWGSVRGGTERREEGPCWRWPAVTSRLGVEGGGAGMKGTRAKVTLAWLLPGLGPRLWECGQKVAPSPGDAGAGRGDGGWRVFRTLEAQEAHCPRRGGSGGQRCGTEDAWRGGLGTRRPASVRAPGSSPPSTHWSQQI